MLEVAPWTLLDQLREQRATARTAADEILTRAASEGRDPAPDELAAVPAARDGRAGSRRRHGAGARPAARRGPRHGHQGPAADPDPRRPPRRPARSAAPSTPRTRRRSRCSPSSWTTTGQTTCPSPSWAGPAGSGSTPATPSSRRPPRPWAPTCTAASSSTWSRRPASWQPAPRSSRPRPARTWWSRSPPGSSPSAIIAEGASITESDPTLAIATLGAFKYANFFQISHELANDTPTNLLDFLARQAALSLGLGADRVRRRHHQRHRLRPAPRAPARRRDGTDRPHRHRHLASAPRAPPGRAPTPSGPWSAPSPSRMPPRPRPGSSCGTPPT